MVIKVAFLSAGLGNVSRGFETSTANWYNAVNGSEGIAARLFSGGKYTGSQKVWNLPRNGRVSCFLRAAGLINDGCRLEQVSFAFGFLFKLLLYRPHVIWIQESSLGAMLLKFRDLFLFRYKIIFCDGAPVGHKVASKFDGMIFLHAAALNDAISHGIDNVRCSLIPYLTMKAENDITKDIARRKFNLAEDHFVIVCVAAWNRHHKRIDYLLEEMGELNTGGTSLLLCGQPDQDHLLLKKMAEELAIDVQWHTLNQTDLSYAYKTADLFVLPSLNEGLPAVLIEAASHELPVICHEHQAGKFIFGESYRGLTDLSVKGTLSRKIIDYRNSSTLKLEGIKTAEIVNQKFNRKHLTGQLIDFINQTYNFPFQKN